ncbi:MAG: NfeD family protein [Spirochaetes bacterium]|nr:NfeD family protein [Spirochaetota bacterium]
MELWIIWLIIAIALIIFEIFTPGFLISIFSIGSIASMISAFFIKNIYVQILIFAIMNLLAFIFLRPLFLKIVYKETNQNKTNTDLLIGKKGKVIEKVDNISGTGRIKIQGIDWKAISIEDNITFEIDEIAEVVKVEGAKVIIKKV